MNKKSGKTTGVLLIVLVVAIALAWLIARSISNIEEPQNYEFNSADTSYQNEEQQDVEAIAETSESTDISDIEADLNFDADAALSLDDFEEEN